MHTAAAAEEQRRLCLPAACHDIGDAFPSYHPYGLDFLHKRLYALICLLMVYDWVQRNYNAVFKDAFAAVSALLICRRLPEQYAGRTVRAANPTGHEKTGYVNRAEF